MRPSGPLAARHVMGRATALSERALEHIVRRTVEVEKQQGAAAL